MIDPDMLDLAGLPDMKVSVSDFIDLLNETYEFGFPSVVVSGELLNLRISRGRWLYFDLKDEFSSLKCFGTVQQLPGPLEDGMLLEVRGAPRMHNQYGFSFNVQLIRPAGEGSIRRASELLRAQLQKEGMFDDARKRQLPYPPQHIGLITARQSAAYADFIKIVTARWGGLRIDVIDSLVQGDRAPSQLVAAINRFNAMPDPPQLLVIIRGGGSVDDLAVFSSELVTRAVAGSRLPTLVAIGHEIDVSLAELAADRRASTPSNAAELLTPDKAVVLESLAASSQRLHDAVSDQLRTTHQGLVDDRAQLATALDDRLQLARDTIDRNRQLLEALSPEAALRRGYAIVRDIHGHALGGSAEADGTARLTDQKSGQVRRRLPSVGDTISLELYQIQLDATITGVQTTKV